MRTDDLVSCTQLRGIRIESGYSIDALAGICGVSRNTIRKLEAGDGVRPTTLHNIFKRIGGVVPDKRLEFDRILFEVANRAPPEPKKPSLYSLTKSFEKEVEELVLQEDRDGLVEFRRALGEIDMMADYRIRLFDVEKERMHVETGAVQQGSRSNSISK